MATATVAVDPGGDEGGGSSGLSPLAVAAVFLLPALLLLGALVVVPVFATVYRSLFNQAGTQFVGVDNYQEMLTSKSTRTALRNTAIWVLIVPVMVTLFGLMFAVLTERVRWATAMKLFIFMPMAISGLSAGVIFRLVYEADPQRGLANAVVVAVRDTFSGERVDYTGANPRDKESVTTAGRGFVTQQAHAVGDVVTIGMLGVPAAKLPGDAEPATTAAPPADGIAGTVWFDFVRGGGGTPNQIDPAEQGLPGIKVEAVKGGQVVGSDTTGKDGTFAITGLTGDGYQLRLAESAFRPAFNGINWLGPSLVTMSIILAYLWMMAGFAMVVIGAGLAAIPRDALEAARVDGANYLRMWWTIAMPLTMPALIVVFVFELKAAWTDLFKPLIFLQDPALYTLSRGLKAVIDNPSIGGAKEWELLAAAGVITTIPMIVVFFLGQRYFIEGIATTGSKG